MSSKGDNSIIQISKTIMSSVIYALKRRQCLHLLFKRRQCLQSFTLSKGDSAFIYFSKGDNFFGHLRFQKATVPSFTFQRRQCLHLKYFNVFCPRLCFIRLDILCFYAFKKKKKRKRTSMSSCFLSFTSLVFASCPVEQQDRAERNQCRYLYFPFISNKR